MTILLTDRKILILKTFKTGSTSLHQYFKDISKDNPNIKITNTYVGHDTLDDLNLMFPEIDFREYTVIAILRYPLQYMTSVYNQFIYESGKQARSLKVIRKVDKVSVKIGFLLFWLWFCVIRKNNTNIVNANYKLLKSYEDCEKFITIPYHYYGNLTNYVEEFNYSEFKKYSARKYSDRKSYDVIPKFMRKKIIEIFIREIDLTIWCYEHEKIFKNYD